MANGIRYAHSHVFLSTNALSTPAAVSWPMMKHLKSLVTGLKKREHGKLTYWYRKSSKLEEEEATPRKQTKGP